MSIKQTRTLQDKLSTIKLKEPGIRTQASFWTLCCNFVDAWAELGAKIRAFQNEIHLPMEMRDRLRNIQKAIKEMMGLVLSSPWGYFARQHGHGVAAGNLASPYPGGGGGRGGGRGGSGSSSHSQQPSTPVPLPMTPQSAALGPAVQATVQATVPSTPQSGSFAAAFSGGFFERADALISMGGPYVGRTGTMNSASTNSLTSVHSGGMMSSQDSSGAMTPNTVFSTGSGPGPLGPLPFRLNGSKVGGF